MSDHDEFRQRQQAFRNAKVAACDHEWQPVSMVFETQLLDGEGRVLIRQPNLERGRVYCVCMKCYGHTYAETAWTGYYLAHDDDPVHGDTEEEGVPQ